MKKLEIYFGLNGLDEMQSYIKGGCIREGFNKFSYHLSHSFKNGYIREKKGEQYYYKNAIYYEDRKFIVIYNGLKYYIDFDAVTIDNYERGEYDAFTCELNKLIEEYNEALKKVEEKERKEQIIEDGEQGIFHDEESMLIYRDYLLENYNKKKEGLYTDLVGNLALVIVSGFFLQFPILTIESIYILILVELMVLLLAGKYMAYVYKKIQQVLMPLWDKVYNIDQLIESKKDLNLEKTKTVEKSNEVSKEYVLNSIGEIISKLNNVDDKEKILLFEKLKKVLDLCSKNDGKLNDNIMLRLNVIKNNLNYMKDRENTYEVGKTKRKVLRPNINNISKKKYTRG